MVQRSQISGPHLNVTILAASLQSHLSLLCIQERPWVWSLVIGHRTQELARHGIILFYTTSTPTITKTTHWCGIHRHRNTFICMFVFCVLFHSLTDFFTLTVTSFVNQIMKYQFKTLATSIGPIIAMSEGNLSAQKYKHYKPFKIST